MTWQHTPPTDPGYYWVRWTNSISAQVEAPTMMMLAGGGWIWCESGQWEEHDQVAKLPIEFWNRRVELPTPGHVRATPEWIASSIVGALDSTQMHAMTPATDPNTVWVPSAGFLWQRIVDVLSGKPKNDWRHTP